MFLRELGFSVVLSFNSSTMLVIKYSSRSNKMRKKKENIALFYLCCYHKNCEALQFGHSNKMDKMHKKRWIQNVILGHKIGEKMAVSILLKMHSRLKQVKASLKLRVFLG